MSQEKMSEENERLTRACQFWKEKARLYSEAIVDREGQLLAAQKRIAELSLLVVDLSTISTRQRSMQIEYPAGTANAEDAWSEFSKWEKSVYARAAALLAEHPQ